MSLRAPSARGTLLSSQAACRRASPESGGRKRPANVPVLLAFLSPCPGQAPLLETVASSGKKELFREKEKKGGRVASRDQGRGRQKEKKWPREVRESVRTKKVSRDLVPAIMKL